MNKSILAPSAKKSIRQQLLRTQHISLIIALDLRPRAISFIEVSPGVANLNRDRFLSEFIDLSISSSFITELVESGPVLIDSAIENRIREKLP